MRRLVVGLSVAFGAVLTLLSLALCRWWLDQPFGDLFLRTGRAGNIAIGAGLGTGIGAAALLVFWKARPLSVFRRLVREGFEGIEPKIVHLVTISVVAGWSEELFFRGILQLKLGIWIAAAAFVVEHGQIRLVNWRKVLLAFSLFAAGVGLGFVRKIWGLEAAMAAHTAYDLVVLVSLYTVWGRGVSATEDGLSKAQASK